MSLLRKGIGGKDGQEILQSALQERLSVPKDKRTAPTVLQQGGQPITAQPKTVEGVQQGRQIGGAGIGVDTTGLQSKIPHPLLEEPKRGNLSFCL